MECAHAEKLSWSDRTPVNLAFDDTTLPADDSRTPFICEKRVP